MLSVINDAAALESARRIDEAQSACQECLDIAARERLPVTIDVLPSIWNGLDSCYANRNDLAGALDWYAQVEECLHAVGAMMARERSPATDSSRPAWYRHPPEGVVVLIPENFAWKDHMANVYDALGVAYDNKNDVARATDYHNHAARLYHHLGNAAREPLVWLHQAHGCQRRGQWDGLGLAAKKMRIIAEHRTKARSCRRSGC
jgi:tetratricopeptide (TPR) repeat protein